MCFPSTMTRTPAGAPRQVRYAHPMVSSVGDTTRAPWSAFIASATDMPARNAPMPRSVTTSGAGGELEPGLTVSATGEASFAHAATIASTPTRRIMRAASCRGRALGHIEAADHAQLDVRTAFRRVLE